MDLIVTFSKSWSWEWIHQSSMYPNVNYPKIVGGHHPFNCCLNSEHYLPGCVGVHEYRKEKKIKGRSRLRRTEVIVVFLSCYSFVAEHTDKDILMWRIRWFMFCTCLFLSWFVCAVCCFAKWWGQIDYYN